jgi:putative ABC transport system ATP-binding protein
LVVRFDPEHYNPNATLAENLLFGTPTKPEFTDDALAENPLILQLLREQGVLGNLLKMGETIAKTMVELLGDLPPGHPFFEQFGFIAEDELPDYRALVARAEKIDPEALSEADQLKLRRLPFKYVESRHRLGLIDEARADRILAVRRRVAERLERDDPGAVEFYQPDSYNAAASLQDNILFGRLAYGRAHAREIVGQAVTEVLESLDLRRIVLAVGFIARALLKEPDLLIINEAAAVMDSATQRQIGSRLLEARRGRGVIWTLQKAAWAEFFDRVLVMRAGRLVEQGTFQELNAPGSTLGELVAAG